MIGTVINHRYRIISLIGSGGMAHVYLAVNVATRRQVAIKVLKEEYKDDPEFLRRFEREARAVLHLSHDNIVRAYGVGQTGGLPYIILEYVEGQSLKQRIQEQGPLAPAEAIEIAFQVLDALDAAHQAGIIHRDVKPQNVLLTKSGAAKLADFGIAREADANTVTYAGSTVLGSVHYLSPEQAKGKPCTEASDLYSAGIMLYEMLTGTVPFSGDNSVAVALKHISEEPVPPALLNSAIPPALNDVIMRALRKNISERYQTARLMRADLFRAQYEPNGSFAREMPALPPAAPGKPARKKAKRRASAMLRVVAVVVTLVLALIVTFFAVRSSFSNEALSLQVVPMLQNRSVDEAKQRAEDYGFHFEIQEYEISDTVPYGNVILQAPESGAHAKQGASIYCIVSLGPDTPTVPSLLGLSPDEAKRAIAAAGYVLGETSYSVSDVEIGFVCGQSPAPGVELKAGETIHISISATSTQGVETPILIGCSLEEALTLLGQAGFTNIRTRDSSALGVPPNLVLSQSPEDHLLAQPDSLVEMQVSLGAARAFSADIAFNLSIPQNATQVIVTMREAREGVAYERVLYEATLEKGEKLPVSFTAYAESGGMHELIVYVAGVEQRRQEASFAEKPAA